MKQTKEWENKRCTSLLDILICFRPHNLIITITCIFFRKSQESMLDLVLIQFLLRVIMLLLNLVPEMPAAMCAIGHELHLKIIKHTYSKGLQYLRQDLCAVSGSACNLFWLIMAEIIWLKQVMKWHGSIASWHYQPSFGLWAAFQYKNASINS